ncbi:hypothetical protein GCM10025874_12720 [Arenivirga flava]|uniref:Uncharacterized protein n=1 Tax=Arenivirga flava TaxID=1930060 RepID=A0AA37X8Z1_9MICO|nr:hypothetical protein GCM10025874_12720 [Arenivirga flava]
MKVSCRKFFRHRLPDGQLDTCESRNRCTPGASMVALLKKFSSLMMLPGSNVRRSAAAALPDLPMKPSKLVNPTATTNVARRIASSRVPETGARLMGEGY